MKKVLILSLIISTFSLVFAQETQHDKITHRGSQQFITIIETYQDTYSHSQLLGTIHYMIERHLRNSINSPETYSIFHNILRKVYKSPYGKSITQQYISPLGYTVLLPKYIEGTNSMPEILKTRETQEGTYLFRYEDQGANSSLIQAAEATTQKELKSTLTSIANNTRTDGHICSFVFNFGKELNSGNSTVQMYMGDDDDEKCIRDRFDSIIRNQETGKVLYWDNGHDPTFRVPITLLNGSSEIVFFDSIIYSSFVFE